MPKPPISPADQARLLAEDPAVLALIPDPDDIPQVLVVRGIFGQGPLADTWRIYLAYDFTQYFEVGSADILHFEPAGDTQRIWLVRKPYRRVVRESYDVEVAYLKGVVETGSEVDLGDGSTLPGEFYPSPTACSKCLHATG